MNYLDYFPDELQEKIYYDAHKLKFKVIFRDIKDFKCKQIEYNPSCYIMMLEMLYNSDMSPKELEDYFTALDYIDEKRDSINIEEMFENRYYNNYDEYDEEFGRYFQ